MRTLLLLPLFGLACTAIDAKVGGTGAGIGEINTDGGDGADGGGSTDSGDGGDGGDGANTGEGTIFFMYGESEDRGDYLCELLWEVETFITDSDCPDCTFTLGTRGSLSGDSYGERDCRDFWIGAGTEFGINEDARRGEPSVFVDYYGYWYGLYYIRFDGGSLTFDYGVVDYPYEYRGEDIFFTYFIEVDLEVPER